VKAENLTATIWTAWLGMHSKARSILDGSPCPEKWMCDSEIQLACFRGFLGLIGLISEQKAL
ncbi:unnamed protein product, partial [Mycena citricolor]